MKKKQNYQFWKLSNYYNNLFVCHPSQAKLRLLIGIGMVWLYIWLCNIFFGANTALSLAEDLTSSSILFSYFPEPLIAFILVLFFPIAGLKFILVPLSVSILVVISGAKYIQFLYSFKTILISLKYLLAVLFGIGYPKLSIEDNHDLNKVDYSNWLTFKGGPGYVIIQPGNAVLLERLESPSRILSTGQHFITRFEKIADVVELKDQLLEVPEEKVMTKDRIIIKIKGVYFRYRVASTARSDFRTSGNNIEPFPFSIQAIRNLHYNKPVSKEGLVKWDTLVQSLGMKEISDFLNKNTFASLSMLDLSEKDPREIISNKLRSPEVRNKFRKIGTKLVWFDVGNFGLSEEYESAQIINSWQANWISKTAATRAIGEAQRVALQERGKAEAQAEMLKRVVNLLSGFKTNDDPSVNTRTVVLARTAQLLELMASQDRSEEGLENT